MGTRLFRRHTARAVLVGALAGGIAVAGATPAPAGTGHGGHGGGPGAPAPPDLAETVTAEGVHAHLEEFQAVADAHDDNRAVGTSGYEASAAYIESVLSAAGYTPERQYFDVERFTVDAFTFDSAVAVEPVVMSYSASTPEGGVSGDVVAPANPLGCDAAAYEGTDVTGDIALVSRGECAFGAKASAAGAAGAAAVIVYNNTDGALNGTLGETLDGSAPAIGVTQAEGQALLDALAAGPLTASLDVQTTLDTVETFNVLAETTTGRDDNVVMVGAHLDSTPDGAGINDNATGSAAILETAVQLAEAGALNNQVRFAWWGAEEIGLLGSAHYVDDLAANDPAGLESVATYLNFDMVGSPNYTIGVYDADESTHEAPVEVPEGSIATEAIFTDYFDGIDQAWVDSEFSGRSDYQAFITNGIPASGLFTGADGVKTEEEAAIFGGTAGELLDPNYHTAADDITNVSVEALAIMAPAIGHATQSLATSTETVNGVPATPAWDARTVYRGGELVYYEGATYEAQWWTKGQRPGGVWGPWAEVGDAVTCGDVEATRWTASQIYTGGEKVEHDGELYAAAWWSRNQEPGSRWGPWRALGAC